MVFFLSVFFSSLVNGMQCYNEVKYKHVLLYMDLLSLFINVGEFEFYIINVSLENRNSIKVMFSFDRRYYSCRITQYAYTFQKNPGTFGTCIPMGDCYLFKHTIDINNCWMVVPKAKLSSQNLTLEVDVFNMAMESLTKKRQVKLI